MKQQKVLKMNGFGEKNKSKKKLIKNASPSKEEIINQAFKFHSQGKIAEAAKYYELLISQGLNYHRVFSNYGVILRDLGKLKEAGICQIKAIQLNPDSSIAHSNLGGILFRLGKFQEAETSTRKAIQLNFHNKEAHTNLGGILLRLRKFQEAELSINKAIELNPYFAKNHYNLGKTLRELGKFQEAVSSYEKAIQIKLDFSDAYRELGICFYLLEEKHLALKNIVKAKHLDPKNITNKLLFNIFQEEEKISKNKSLEKINSTKTSLESNPAILNLPIELELINDLYKIKTRNQGIYQGPTYGDAEGSDFNLFDRNEPNIIRVKEKLITISEKTVNSNILVSSSFFTIFRSGGGLISHDHLSETDKIKGLNIANRKFSLVYYLSVGDQECDEPGVLKLEDPIEEILPNNGLVIIFPAERKHSVFYKGNKDRVIIGVNFYSI